MSDDLVVEFAVYGAPEPRGSKSSMVIYVNRAKKVPARRPDGGIVSVVVDTNDGPSKKWMELVDIAARTALPQPWAPIEDTALEVELTFFLERIEGHYGTGRNSRLVKDSARARPHVRPDTDKLGRGTLDALSGIVWKDDGQLVRVVQEKHYAVPKGEHDDGQGVMVRVTRCAQQRAVDLPLALRERWMADRPADDAEADQLPLGV